MKFVRILYACFPLILVSCGEAKVSLKIKDLPEQPNFDQVLQGHRGMLLDDVNYGIAFECR